MYVQVCVCVSVQLCYLHGNKLAYFESKLPYTAKVANVTVLGKKTDSISLRILITSLCLKCCIVKGRAHTCRHMFASYP